MEFSENKIDRFEAERKFDSNSFMNKNGWNEGQIEEFPRVDRIDNYSSTSSMDLEKTSKLGDVFSKSREEWVEKEYREYLNVEKRKSDLISKSLTILGQESFASLSEGFFEVQLEMNDVEYKLALFPTSQGQLGFYCGIKQDRKNYETGSQIVMGESLSVIDSPLDEYYNRGVFGMIYINDSRGKIELQEEMPTGILRKDLVVLLGEAMGASMNLDR